MAGASDLDARAATAERSVTGQFGGRLLGMPGTHLARVQLPAGPRLGRPWHYWWQAHYLDAVVDSALRALRAGDFGQATTTARRGDRLLATIRLRNLGRWSNAFYDDMAWLALASGRLATLHAELGRTRPRRPVRASERVLTAQLRSAVTDDLGGGAYWNTTRDFKNAPATGPVALHLARIGDTTGAGALVDWLYARLVDPGSGLVLDGIRVERGVEREVRDVYTYNQGTVLGALVTLGDPASLERAAALVRAVDVGLATTVGECRMLSTHGGGDGGLFTGILVRYLALAESALTAEAAATARRLIADTAEGFWSGRARRVESDDGPLDEFSSDPAAPAVPGGVLELSTQLQAWMTLEAAAAVPR